MDTSGVPPLTVSAPSLGTLTPADDLRRAKADLRRRVRRAREAIGDAERTRMAGMIEERLFGLPELATAGTVLLFYSFGSEVTTAAMVDRVHAAGKRLLLPYLAEGRAEGSMEAAVVRLGDDLIPASYGAREPARRVPVDPSEVDLVVAPGLAFDRRGYRLGYGGGHYDRYLSRLRPDAVRVGIGFAVQVVERVPTGPGDRPVDLVVTENEVIDCRAG
jgi:5-formyltetrahydrofolate cyclo-ligase